MSEAPSTHTRHAACSCGQLHLTASGEPLRISMCHCLACQRRTGSTFCVQARFAATQVQVQGRSQTYVRTGDSGGQARFHFCPDCGAIVLWFPQAMPDVVMVPVGAFADPSFPAPRVSVYEARRHPWTAIPVDAEHFD